MIQALLSLLMLPFRLALLLIEIVGRTLALLIGLVLFGIGALMCLVPPLILIGAPLCLLSASTLPGARRSARGRYLRRWMCGQSRPQQSLPASVRSSADPSSWPSARWHSPASASSVVRRWLQSG